MRLLILGLCLVFIDCASSSKWQFEEPQTTMVVTQRLVVERKQPVLFVLHDKEGDWQFLAYEKSQIDQVVQLSLSDLIALDSSLAQVAQLKRGWKAWRTEPQSPWNFGAY